MSATELLARYPYALTFLLFCIGLWGIAVKRNLMKKLIGLTVFQTAIFLFFVQGATRLGATIPILDPALGNAADKYANPLPQVVILTAIVVGVALTGVALALMLVVHRHFGSLDEDEILGQMREDA